MNKDLKIVHNVLQCVLCNSSRCHYLEPLRKGVIAKMAYLVELCLILESNLVERAPQNICCMDMKMLHKILKKCTITDNIWSYEFGSVMKKL
jgi:hypothetical protein